MIAGLELALAMGADNLLVQSDSQLVFGQVNTEFDFRDPQMAKYASLVKQKLNRPGKLNMSPETVMRGPMP